MKQFTSHIRLLVVYEKWNFLYQKSSRFLGSGIVFFNLSNVIDQVSLLLNGWMHKVVVNGAKKNVGSECGIIPQGK